MAKKTLGYIFIVLSVLLALALLAQSGKVIKSFLGFIVAFTGALDAYHASKEITKFVVYVAQCYAVFFLWTYGKRWTKKSKVPFK